MNMRFLKAFLPVALLTAIDQITKFMASARLSDGPLVLWEGVFEFRYYVNTGAAFSLLEGKFVFFYVGTALVCAFIIYALCRMPAERKYRPLAVTLLFLMAGALGNLIDRVFLKGVRDFLYFSLIDFPIFNVADIFVTCSAAVLAFLIIFRYKDEKDFDFLKRNRKPETDE